MRTPRSSSVPRVLHAAALLFAWLGGLAPAGSAQDQERPNVVLLLADDLGTLDTGAFGSDDLRTPHLDRLAAEGVRFTQFYAHAVCCPSRALLLTGRHPQRGGVNTWTQGDAHAPEGVHLHLGELTLAEVLRAEGYRTGLFGKWHLGASLEHGPTLQGFEEFFGLRGGFVDNHNHHFLHGQGFHDLYEGTAEVFREGEFLPELVVGRSVDFIERHRDEPFFLFASFNLPHYPEQAEPAFAEAFDELEEPRRSYARVVSTLDAHVGRILDALDEHGLSERTVVAFLSDNGHSVERFQIRVDDHASGLPRGHRYGAQGGGGNTGPWRGAKGSFYEGGLRVPALLRYPGSVPAGEVRAQAAHAGDLFPTLLELVGVELPEVALDGRSLLGVLRDADAPEPHGALHWQWFENWAVRRGDWKLLGRGEGEQLRLLSLDGDQPERAEHAAQQPELVRELLALHEAWSEDVRPQRGLQRARQALAAAGEPVEGLRVYEELTPSAGRAYAQGERLVFQVPGGVERLSWPRLHNPMRGVRLLGGDELQLRQNGTRWWVRLTPSEVERLVILELEGAPWIPHAGAALRAGADGVLVLPAHRAAVHGERLCYEPQPHKNTLGYWVNVNDWASWEIELPEAGEYELVVLQGCGTGQGGSQVEVRVADGVLRFFVEDTGHFQNFVPRRLGRLALEAGAHTVELRPVVLAANAVMDVRELRLIPAP